MAKSKSITKSHPHTAKPAASTPAPTHINNWVNINPAPSVLGGALLDQIKRALAAHKLLDEHLCHDRSEEAFEIATEFTTALALVPPKGPTEALAAACMLFSEAADIEEAHGWGEARCKEWSLRMKRRAYELANWLEYTHKIERRDHGLDYFCSGGRREELFPHVAPVIHVASPKLREETAASRQATP